MIHLTTKYINKMTLKGTPITSASTESRCLCTECTPYWRQTKINIGCLWSTHTAPTPGQGSRQHGNRCHGNHLRWTQKGSRILEDSQRRTQIKRGARHLCRCYSKFRNSNCEGGMSGACCRQRRLHRWGESDEWMTLR